MNDTEKKEIQERLQAYCLTKGSQNKAANSLRDVSAATISKLLNGEWELINDTMWRNIASQIGAGSRTWNIVETRDYRMLNQLFGDAQLDSEAMAICGEPGTGKSNVSKHYSENNPNVYVLSCSDFWNRKFFLHELLRVMGRTAHSDTVGDLIQLIVGELKKIEKPLIIMDEADKLSDNVLYFFITMYNQLEGSCGLVLLATNYLEKRIERGRRLNRKGYKEIYSRIGKNFIPMFGANANDITEVCMANGISDKAIIGQIVRESEGDLRRVKRKIYAIKKRNEKNITA
ncbi:MAG: ATP-binding protein [Bacteroidales bacterium]|jgi:DNA transposition AAA+ family ATPase|nr:ATP-binding protein [Bacteroidales bacterium]